MKKIFTFKGVLDGFRSSSNSSSQLSSKLDSAATEVEETLKAEHFQAAKTVRHGFPYDPKAVAFDPIQKILAIGTKSGSLRLFCQPGVECHVSHPCQAAVIQLMFLINEGALVSVCADDSLHLWNLRQKMPEIAHSLKFQRERITCCHLPFQSKWLYIGTERGNIHVANVESFVLSGYVINWNKAIELSRKTHPGAVVHLSDNPIDPNKMLIGFESGSVVLWDLRNKIAECRFQYSETLRSISWHHEGKQFMCSHVNGSLSTWNIRNTLKPINVIYPHGKTNKDGRPEYCKPIDKVEWKMSRTGDPYIIFSGGLNGDAHEKTPSVTIIYGKTTTVLEMEHDVIDFITLCESPWESDLQDPYAVVVLLHNDLVLIDLTTPGYPCFENPYPMDLHESPVTYCTYLVDCPNDLIPALYSVGSKATKRSGFSEKAWPVSGGEWGNNTCSYYEIIITGHADGSLKFWDSSSVSLQVLYKLKTAKVFEKPKVKSFDGQEDDPFAIQQIAFCPESRVLCVAGASSQVLLFRFSKTESVAEVPSLEIPIIYELNDEHDCSPDYEYASKSIPTSEMRRSDRGSCSSEEGGRHSSFEYFVPLKMKSGPLKRGPGFQAELVCLTPWVDGEPPGQITALSVNSSYGIMAYGNENGLVVIDIVQRTCLLNLGTPDLYGTLDPYQRIPRSPKKNPSDNNVSDSERNRSPTASDQTFCSLPISLSESAAFYVDLDKCVPSDTAPPTTNSTASVENKSSEVDKNANSISSNNGNDQTVFDMPPVAPPRRRKKHATKTLSEPLLDEIESANIDHENDKHSKFNRRKTASNLDESQPKDDQKVNFVKQFKRSVSMKDRTKNKEVKRTKFGVTDKDVLVDLRGNKDVVVDTFRKLKSQISKSDKLDSSFSRSRSSSMSSLENISSEAIQHLTFVDSFCCKNEYTKSPSLWVGTSLGSVIAITLNLPPGSESRLTQPIMVSPSGTIFRLKGPILNISFLDCTGAVIPDQFDSWKNTNRADQSQATKEEKKPVLVNSNSLSTPTNHNKGRASPTTSFSSEAGDQQFVVLASEKQARVLALPSQTSIYRVTITETSFVVRADVTPFRDSACLFCYVANGNITAFSLPSLKMLLNEDFLPLTDLRIARTICFSNYSHGLYLCTPSEIQKFTVSADHVYNLQEMLGQLFLSKDMPEAPKQGFFKGLFGGGPSSLDREELFGESSGKPSRSVAKHIPGTNNLEHIQAKAGTLAGEVSRTRMALQERGEALGLLEERTTRMMNESEQFSHVSHQLMLKYKDKKWYQL